MDNSWLPVSAAAAQLDASARRVRALLHSRELHGRQIGGRWFVDPADVAGRVNAPRPAGRPLSPRNAWSLARALSEPDQAAVHLASSDPVDRSRLRRQLADLPGPERLARLVSARAKVSRVRVHPGALNRLLADADVSVGGALAVAAHGVGLSESGRPRIYIAPSTEADVRSRYRLVDDDDGNLDLAVVPVGIDGVGPQPGQPVPIAVGMADLLDSADSRARHAAAEWFQRLPGSIVVADGRRT